MQNVKKDLLDAENSKIIDFLNKQIFTLALALWITINTLHSTLWQFSIIENNFNTLKIICLVLLILKEIVTLRHDTPYFSIFLICVLAFAITYNSKDISIVILAAFIIEARNIEFSKIAEVSILINICILIVTIYASQHGLLENRIFAKNDGTPRYGLGFMYTTYPSQLLFFSTAAWVSIRNKSIKIWELLALLLANIYIYSETKTANPLICVVLLLILVFFAKIDKNFYNNSFVKFMGNNIFFICAAIIFSATILYSNVAWLKEVDQLVSNRLRLGNTGLTEYGISIFGKNVVLSGSEYGLLTVLQTKYNYIDSSYIQIAVKYGIIVIAYLLIGFRQVQKKLLSNNDIYSYISCIAVACQAMLDPQLIMLQYNPFILLLGVLIVRKGQKKDDMLYSN